MTKKALPILLFIVLLSFLTWVSTLFSQMPWAFVFLKGGYSFGLIPLKVFLQYINNILLATLTVSSLLFIIGFYLVFRNQKTDKRYWLSKIKTLSLVFFSALLVFLVLNSAILIVFIPQINQAGANIDQFVNENKDKNLPEVVNNLNEFLVENNYLSSWQRNESVFEIDEKIFTNPIDKPLIESFGISRGDLIVFQRWGGCGQTAILTEEILLKCGYDARRAAFIGIDHAWAEAKYNGNWTIVDPWCVKNMVDIHNLGEYYPDYKNAKGVEIKYSNGTTFNEYQEYGYT